MRLPSSQSISVTSTMAATAISSNCTERTWAAPIRMVAGSSARVAAGIE